HHSFQIMRSLMNVGFNQKLVVFEFFTHIIENLGIDTLVALVMHNVTTTFHRTINLVFFNVAQHLKRVVVPTVGLDTFSFASLVIHSNASSGRHTTRHNVLDQGQ